MTIFGRGCLWAVTLCAVDVLVGLRGADAHGFLTAPKVEFPQNGEDITAYSATIDGATALPVPAGMHYDWGPSVAVEAFAAAIGNSSYKTLREFVMKHQTMQKSKAISPECGRTKGVDGSGPQPLPEKYVVWQHGDNEGFTPSHEGPCELWCDDERVFSEKNCAKSYSQIPAKLPFERVKCVGKKRLQIVWLALHETRWQVYMNCAHLANAQAATPAADTPSAVDPPKDGLGTVEPVAASSYMPAASSTPAVNTKMPSTTVQVFPQVVTQPPATVAASTATLTALSPTPMTNRPPTSTPRPTDDEYSNTAADHLSATLPPASVSIDIRTSAPTSTSKLTANGVKEESSTTRASHSQPCEVTMHSHQRPYRPVSWPRRATEESEDEEGSVSGSLASMNTESWDPYAEKATGPIPEEIFESARRDFEAEEKKKQERRKVLKQEFGYA